MACTPGAGFSDWIEEPYNRQVTGGCVANPLQDCPTTPTNRQQMAAFLVKNFGLVLYGPYGRSNVLAAAGMSPAYG